MGGRIGIEFGGDVFPFCIPYGIAYPFIAGFCGCMYMFDCPGNCCIGGCLYIFGF
jgi:hypothetical protein